MYNVYTDHRDQCVKMVYTFFLNSNTGKNIFLKLT